MNYIVQRANSSILSHTEKLELVEVDVCVDGCELDKKFYAGLELE